MWLYFVRHGESEANVLHKVSNRDFKHPLTEKGREQSRALARSLQGIPLARLFTSPLMRAVQTAEILADALYIPYEVSDALREYDCGILEGRSDEECERLHAAQREAWLKDDQQWEERIEGGESFYDIRDRFVPFIESLSQRYAGSQDNILLVGHGGHLRLYAAARPEQCWFRGACRTRLPEHERGHRGMELERFDRPQLVRRANSRQLENRVDVLGAG